MVIPLNPSKIALEAGSQILKHQVTLGWKEGIMLATVIACVVNAVQAFFLGWMWMGYTFLLAGGTLTLSSYYVHYFNDGITLENTVEVLRKENEKMKQINQEFEQKTKTLEEECQSLAQIKGDMQGTVKQLEGDIDTLHIANTQLASQRQQMEGTVNTLTSANSGLRSEIANLTPLVRSLEAGNALAEQQSQRLGQEVEDLKKEISALQAEKQRWDAAMKEMEDKLAAVNTELANTLSSTGQASQKMLEQWHQEATNFDQGLTKAHDMLDALQKVIKPDQQQVDQEWLRQLTQIREELTRKREQRERFMTLARQVLDNAQLIQQQLHRE